MKKRAGVSALFIFLACSVFAQTTKYVVLISIDGLRPDFYLDSNWMQPNLEQLKQGGIYAMGVRGSFPTVTYPSHTTIITGALPARHGIYYNTLFEPGGNASEKWYWQYSYIQTKTIWDAAHKARLTTAALSWPVTVGAPIDYNVPEIWVREGGNVDARRQNATPKGFLTELETNATGILTEDDFNSDYLRIDENTARQASYIIRTYKPNLIAVHFVCVDHYQHEEGKNGVNVHKALASADHGIGDILEALQQAHIKDSTAIIITGDHGFTDVHQTLAPNVWLAENGLLSKDDWKAKFHATGGSAFLHLKDKKDKKTLAQVQKILKDLPWQYQQLFTVIDRKEMDRIGADPDAALALSTIPGTALNNAMTGEVLKPYSGGVHGQFPEVKQLYTGFIGYGPAFNKELVIPVLNQEDIAPLIAAILHLHYKAKDGVLQGGILK